MCYQMDIALKMEVEDRCMFRYEKILFSGLFFFNKKQKPEHKLYGSVVSPRCQDVRSRLYFSTYINSRNLAECHQDTVGWAESQPTEFHVCRGVHNICKSHCRLADCPVNHFIQRCARLKSIQRYQHFFSFIHKAVTWVLALPT